MPGTDLGVSATRVQDTEGRPSYGEREGQVLAYALATQTLQYASTGLRTTQYVSTQQYVSTGLLNVHASCTRIGVANLQYLHQEFHNVHLASHNVRRIIKTCVCLYQDRRGAPAGVRGCPARPPPLLAGWAAHGSPEARVPSASAEAFCKCQACAPQNQTRNQAPKNHILNTV
eukprot:3940568-Rhodomonas_salina.2